MHFEFSLMSFGVINAHDIFMSLINLVFLPYFDEFVMVFINNILVSSKTKENHAKYLRIILETLGKNKLYGKLSKCEFWLNIISFLGHIVSKDGISVDPNKISIVKD